LHVSYLFSTFHGHIGLAVPAEVRYERARLAAVVTCRRPDLGDGLPF